MRALVALARAKCKCLLWRANCKLCCQIDFTNMLFHAAGPSTASASQSQQLSRLYLTVTRERNKESEKGHFNPLGMTRFLCLSILKMLMHVFAMHAEYSLKTQLKRKHSLKLDFQTGRQRWKMTEGLINIKTQTFIFGRWHFERRENTEKSVVKQYKI